MAEPVRKRFDVVVVGAGPAGLSAAAAASESEKTVCIVDDNPAIGGQIWRGDAANAQSDAAKLSARLRNNSVEILCGTRVVQKNGDSKKLFAERHDALIEIEYS